MNMILKDLHDDDKGGWPDDVDDEDDLDEYKVGLTWMICQMMIIDKKGTTDLPAGRVGRVLRLRPSPTHRC